MDWCWSWRSITLATWCKELTHWKRPDAGKDWGQEEKGTTEDEMVRWHHRLNGHKFEQTPGVGDGQGGLACCSPWGRKELDTTERLNWTDTIMQNCKVRMINMRSWSQTLCTALKNNWLKFRAKKWTDSSTANTAKGNRHTHKDTRNGIIQYTTQLSEHN